MATNTLSYVDFDFDTIVTQLQDRMANRNAWKDLYRSGTGEVILEVMAYVLNMGLFYTERRAEESYLPTAKLRSSVVNLVSLIGYSPKRKSSATGNLQFSISVPSSKIVYIPKYTSCQTSDGVKYLTNASAAIVASCAIFCSFSKVNSLNDARSRITSLLYDTAQCEFLNNTQENE